MTKTGILKPKTPQETSQLIKVALGEEKADLAIVNANVVNVYTGEVLKDHAISVKGKWIAYMGKNVRDAIGSQTEVIDAKDQTVIPGLVDGHTHIAWLFTAAEFLRYAIVGGTTTVVTETLEPYSVGGYDGVIEENMVLCVESYIGQTGDSEGVKLEEQVVVTADGNQSLSTFPFEEDLLN